MSGGGIGEQSLMREFGSILSNEIILGQLANEGTDYRGALDPRRKLGDYLQVVFGLEPARHHRVWIDALEDESKRKICIITPPGHAKTTVAGVGYPSWKIGNYLDRHFLYYGNTLTQARKQSVAIRDLTQTEAYQSVFPDVRRSPKGWAGDKWFLERDNIWDKDATMIALGVDGPALGSRTDEIIFDDVCDLENMNTDESRKKVRHKIVSVAFSRQSGASQNTRMVSVMTRWHEEDLAKLFEEHGFEIIWMPALGYWEMVTVAPVGVKPEDCADHTHPPTTLAHIEDLAEKHDLNAGGPLWPEEYPREFLEGFMAEEDAWTLEYQGLAKRPGGNQFKTEHFTAWTNSKLVIDGEEQELKRLDPEHIRGLYQFWDTASKKGADNDFWVGETWAWAVDGYYLLHTESFKAEFPEGLRRVIAYNRRTFTIHGEQDREFSPRTLYIESTGTNNGAAVVQSLAEKRIKAIEWKPDLSKEERAGRAMVWLDEKPIYFPAEESAYSGWVESTSGRAPLTIKTFVAQFLSFPRARHDDIVDTTSMALEQLTQMPVNVGDKHFSRLSINELLTRNAVRVAPIVVVNQSSTGGGVGRRIQKGYFSGRGKSTLIVPGAHSTEDYP